MKSSQQLNDRYMDGAREIKKLAELQYGTDVSGDVPSKILVCLGELKYLQDELTSMDVGDIHFVLRGRLQYLICVLNFLIDAIPTVQLINLFEESMPGLIIISSTLSERQTELSELADQTSWFKMSHIAVNCLISKILRKYPQSRPFLDIPLSECMTMCASGLWEVQYLGVAIILSSLMLEHSLFVESITTASTVSSKATASSSKKPPGSNLINSASTPAIPSAGVTNTKLLTSQSSKKQLVAPSSRGGGAAASKSTRATMKEISSSSNNDSKRMQMSADDTAPTSESNALSVKIVSSSKGLTGSKSFKVVSIVEEMYKSGFYRTLVWLLLHQNPLVRCCAAEILLFSAVKSSLQSNMFQQQQSPVTSNLWACCLEQGIVPQLEYVCQTVPIVAVDKSINGSVSSGKMTSIFPEPMIIDAGKFVLECISKDLMQSETTRNRVLNAMLHSGNSKLRLNIFSGLLYCCARYNGTNVGENQLGRVLWEARSASATNSLLTASNPAFDLVVDDIGVGGGVFNDLLTCLCRDLVELRAFLSVLIHFLNSALQAHKLQNSGTEMSTQTNSYFYCSDKQIAELVVSIEPTVVVVDTDRVNRMKCPACSVINTHSPRLANLLSSALERQLQQIPALRISSGEFVSEVERTRISSTAIDSMDNSSFYQFYGSYRIWQEIFSHMVDSFIMKSSVANMSTTDLIEAFHIATRYGMQQLQQYYSTVLIDRLSIPTFFQIFQAGVGLRMKSQLLLDPLDSCINYKVNILLSYSCVKFLCEYAEKIVTMKRPMDTVEIVKCLRRIAYYLLNSY